MRLDRERRNQERVGTWLALLSLELLVVAGVSVGCREEEGGIGALAVRERIAINSGSDSWVHSGADVRWYADKARATEVARIDGAGGMQLAIPTSQATATPGLLINNLSVGNAIEIQDAGTPVWSVSGAGAVVQTGDSAVTGDLVVTGAGWW